MNFFKILIALFFLFFASISFADNHGTNLTDGVKEIVDELEEEVPLNDPFAGNEGSSGSLDASIPDEEKQDEMSLYNFKLAGLISGKENSYISLVNAGGEVITVTLGQFLGKIKLVDLRITEAIFEKEDKSFVIIDFNNVIREANEY
tara:strand:- start:1369 stop:1809 length:441 start_codon:yes stop_codon:yes gene_type:complete